MSSLIDQINAQLAALKLQPLNQEQIDCLRDRSRLEEAAGMLDDLRARCGVRLPFPAGQDLGPVFQDEEQAREQAEEQAHAYEAVCIEVMASDDHRSYGGSEYRVIGFTGPDGALAAACDPCALAYWVDGQEYAGD
jgi:hypothetical protein